MCGEFLPFRISYHEFIRTAWCKSTRGDTPPVRRKDSDADRHRWYNRSMALRTGRRRDSRVKTTRTLRRVSQWSVFLLFVFLFLNTEYKDNDVLRTRSTCFSGSIP